MILTRKEFGAWWDELVAENPSGRKDHPLWLPETELRPGPPSEWFVFVKEPDTELGDNDYWNWCNDNLTGLIRCYMLEERDDGEWAWWGFTNKQDITLWLLKWS